MSLRLLRSPKSSGILEDESQAISGKELEQLSDEDLAANIRHYCVYARVTPTDKIRIVKAWQAAGEIVAMTGDGVNDAPVAQGGRHRLRDGYYRNRRGEGRGGYDADRRQFRDHCNSRQRGQGYFR